MGTTDCAQNGHSGLLGCAFLSLTGCCLNMHSRLIDARKQKIDVQKGPEHLSESFLNLLPAGAQPDLLASCAAGGSAINLASL